MRDQALIGSIASAFVITEDDLDKFICLFLLYNSLLIKGKE